jgi:hypothetical protein
MIYMWFTGINYYKLAVEKDRDSIFAIIIMTIWKPDFTIPFHMNLLPSEKEQTMVNTPFWTVLGLGYRASFS